jgi:hypothetical protein
LIGNHLENDEHQSIIAKEIDDDLIDEIAKKVEKKLVET